MPGGVGELSLRGLVHRVCELLDARNRGSEEFDRKELDDIVVSAMPEALQRIVGQRAEVKGRTGIGTAADVPWVGLFRSGQGTSAQQGFYVVYLFAADGSAAYLSLNQGTEEIKGGAEVLVKRAIDLRRAARAPEEFEREIDLRSSNNRPRKYEAGSALARRYERDLIPLDEEFETDLRQFLEFSDTASAARLSWEPVREPLHLVFKWNLEREPRTIDIHREIADEKGAVWWGRFANSPTPSIATRKLEALQDQVQHRIPTHAYLYRRGVLWQTVVNEIRTDPPSEDDERFPSYYRPEQCNLFVLLSDFKSLDPGWLANNVVLASQPDADPARIASALGNQTNPMFVFELAGLDSQREPIVRTEEDEDDGWSVDDLGDVSLVEVCEEIKQRTEDAGLSFGTGHDAFIRSAVVSLATKRFLLLTGLSGSGKTRLAIALGEWFGPDRIAVVPVRPDWMGPEAIFGFENGLSKPKNGKHAWTATRSLEFILRAADDPDHPYLLVFDEMNLAHVERYFADALSGMESLNPVVPHLRRDGDEWRPVAPRMLPFPHNLFVVGTVNIDETTYMFSPKVLDRANTLEFRVRTEDLQIGSTPISDVEPGSPLLVRRFLETATTVADDDDWGAKSQLGEWLLQLHRLLSEHDCEFGHRVFVEALRYGALLADAGEINPLAALDAQILQKILPRMHGSIRQIGDPLAVLAAWCWHGPDGDPATSSFDALEHSPGSSAALPLSFDKIWRMTRRLRANHFVAFAE